MAVTRPTYATREEVKAALDVKLTARADAIVDGCNESATEAVEGFLKRKFYPKLMTRYWDWPNYQYAYPWRVWLDAWEVADSSSAVVTSGGVVIPANTVLWEPVNSGPPFTYFELDRSSTSGLGGGPTPQRNVGVTAPFGYWAKTTPAGALAAAMSDTTSTTATVTNSAALGVGDTIVVGSERMLVADKAMVSTGQTQQGSGVSTASSSDVALGVTDGTKYFVGETLLLDSERMLIVDIAGNTVTVKRAWDGTVLATHTGATIYAPRLLTVTRGELGTTAATHLIATAVNRGLVPSLVRNLTIAESLVDVVQKSGGYAHTQASGAAKQIGIGAGLDALREQAFARYGRKARKRVI